MTRFHCVTLSHFLRPSSLFQVDGGLTNETISNRASSLLYPLKYYHHSTAPRFSDVPIIAQLQRLATVLQRQGDMAGSSTREDLQALNKWLDWQVYIAKQIEAQPTLVQKNCSCQAQLSASAFQKCVFVRSLQPLTSHSDI